MPVGSASPALLPAAVALRWSRPDLTATLAELALDAATDADTWVVAAGWLLHGRAALGDGRDTMCDLLDGLGRWGAAGVERMAGAAGRRLRVEMAGPVRRIGEPAVARALLSAEAGVDDDAELRADVLTGLARCAVDEAPDTADDALAAAEQAWRATGCAPGLASVMLLRAARDRRAGRTDEATAQATAGVALLSANGRTGTTASDHLAAALTAEWIAALVEAGRLDEARDTALPAADRLIAAARTSRQVAGLRLAIARVGAVADGPDVVLAALEPAAQDAAASDAPELESACRSMLGELHEQAGRLDRALAELRAAMTAERRDRDRATRLRGLLGAATPVGRPGVAPSPTPASPADALSCDDAPRPDGALPPSDALRAGDALRSDDALSPRDTRRPDDVLSPWIGTGALGAHHDTASGSTARRGTAGRDDSAAERPHGGPALERPEGAGRGARRRAAELSALSAGGGRDDDRVGGGWPDAGLLFGRDATATAAVPRGEDPEIARRVDTEWASTAGTAPTTHRPGGSFIGDALFRELAQSSGAPQRWGDGDPVGATSAPRSTLDGSAGRRDTGRWTESASVSDTVVFGQPWEGPGGDRATPDAGRSRHHGDPGPGGGNLDGGSGAFRPGSTGYHPGDRPAGSHGRRPDLPGRGGRTGGPALDTGPHGGPAARGGPAHGGARVLGDPEAPSDPGTLGDPGARGGPEVLGGPGSSGRHGAPHGPTGPDAPAAPDHTPATPGPSHDAARPASSRRPARSAATDDGMGLAELLAGALAAYRKL